MLRNARKRGPFALCCVVCLGFLSGMYVQTLAAAWPPKDPAVVAQLESFAAEKEDQAGATNGHIMAEEFKTFFDAGKKGDWLEVSNQFKELSRHAPAYSHTGKTDERLCGTLWEAIKETWGGYDAFASGEEKYSASFARDVIDSIPPGSIYFGGTDQGRFLITAMQKSQVKGTPFFTLTQNPLADNAYLEYLRSMYGHAIHIPSAGESQQCFQSYVTDAAQRSHNHQLKSGEDVTMKDGRVQVSGQVAVMAINALIVKTIFDENTDRNFFIEESFALDWMYPYLEPHGVIFKLNRRPLAALSGEMTRQDHEYWGKLVRPMIGSWLNTETSVEQLAGFADRVFVQRDFSGFDGDLSYARNSYTQKLFAKERSSIGDLYLWRARHAADGFEKKRMWAEADFAFRQAFALCPYALEAVAGYVGLLSDEERKSDALLIVKTAKKTADTNIPGGSDDNWIRDYLSRMEESMK
jgi:hypothetical protein